MKYHVAGAELDNGVRVGRAVIEQLDDAFHGSFGGFGLLGGECTNGGEQGGIDCSSVEEKGSEDFLDSLSDVGVEWR